MEAGQYEHRYSSGDMLSMAGSQALSLIAAAGSVTVLAVHFLGAASVHGMEVRTPYAVLLGTGAGGLALYSAAHLPGMFAFYWKEPKARRRIAACMVQVLVTGLIAAVLGLLCAGPWGAWTLTNVTLLQWIAYGFLAGGVLHILVATLALVLLISGRDLPEIDS